MTIWHLHLLNARHGLTWVMSDLRATLREAVARTTAYAALPDFDLVVRAVPGGGLPRWGVSGQSLAPGVVELTLDPARFQPGHVTRTLVHEFHHLMRWDGPGYGRSLGEALVSEGLAGHFVLQVLGGPPDPWDATTVTSGVPRQAMNEWGRRDYDHGRWFFGKGDLRNWTGYGLGHRLVGDYLALHPDQTAASLAGVRAEPFRDVLRKLVAADRVEEAADEAQDSPAGD